MGEMMSDVRSYVAFKRECMKSFPLDVEVEVYRSGQSWGASVRDEWAAVYGRYHIGHSMTVKEWCDDLVASHEAESWNAAHIG